MKFEIGDNLYIIIVIILIGVFFGGSDSNCCSDSSKTLDGDQIEHLQEDERHE